MSINAVYEDSQGNVHESRMDGVDLTTKISIADDFSALVNYAVGDFCYHLGILYKCTTAHTAGAWNAAHFAATQVGDELSELKNTISGLTTILVDDSFTVTGNGSYYKSFQKDLSKDGYEVISISYNAGTLDYIVAACLRTINNKRVLIGDVYRRDNAAFSNTVNVSYGAIYLKMI